MKAQLDSATGKITLPLEKFSPSSSEQAQSQAAADRAMNACMKPHGVTIPKSSPPNSSENRSYGIWVRSYASKYGYEMPPDTSRVELDLSKLTQEQNSAWDNCTSQLSKVPGAVMDGMGPDALSEELRRRARGAAASDPAWEQTVKAWKSCLKSKGHEIEDKAEKWVPVKPENLPKEQEVRLAVDDVSCKESTGLVQKLADLEASYQQTLVNQNEAALKAQRDKIESQAAAAKKYVAEHGAS